MIESVGPTLSALTGFQKKMNTTANNIANANTDKFKKNRVTFQDRSSGGIDPVEKQVNSPGYTKETIRDDRIATVESSNVDLSEEIPEMQTTKSAYSANLKMLKAKDEMIGSMLDIVS